MPNDANRDRAIAIGPMVGRLLVAHFCLVASPASAIDRGAGPAPADDARASQPFRVPETGKVELWRLPVGRLVVLTDSPRKTAWTFPMGGNGRSLVREVRDPQGNGRDGLAVYGYREWRDVEGPVRDALIEFPLTLPKRSPLQLRTVMAFSNPFGQGGSKPLAEPVTWRVHVRLAGRPVGESLPIHFAWHSRVTAWQEAIVDLSDYAGQTIWLQLAIPPTRGRNQVYWVEPTLLAGHFKGR
jgi:hypothetical protein